MLVAIAIPVFTSQLQKSREATDLANIRCGYAAAVTQFLQGDGSADITVGVPAKQTIFSEWRTSLHSIGVTIGSFSSLSFLYRSRSPRCHFFVILKNLPAIFFLTGGRFYEKCHFFTILKNLPAIFSRKVAGKIFKNAKKRHFHVNSPWVGQKVAGKKFKNAKKRHFYVSDMVTH